MAVIQRHERDRCAIQADFKHLLENKLGKKLSDDDVERIAALFSDDRVERVDVFDEFSEVWIAVSAGTDRPAPSLPDVELRMPAVITSYGSDRLTIRLESIEYIDAHCAHREIIVAPRFKLAEVADIIAAMLVSVGRKRASVLAKHAMRIMADYEYDVVHIMVNKDGNLVATSYINVSGQL